MGKKPLTTFEMAKYCHVTHRAVLKWIAEGKLKSYRTPGNHSRVHKDDFIAFLKQYNMPVPQELNREGGKKRVLVVDDDKTMVALLKKVLRKSGQYEIAEAYDGFGAGKKFTEFKPDLVTLDIQMPYLNGLEVLKQVREGNTDEQPKVIIVSAINDDIKFKQAMSLGADDYFTKPLDTKRFLSKVDELLEAK